MGQAWANLEQGLSRQFSGGWSPLNTRGRAPGEPRRRQWQGTVPGSCGTGWGRTPHSLTYRLPSVPQVRGWPAPRACASLRRCCITCCAGSRDTTPPATSATKWSTKCEYSDGGTRGCGPCPRSPTAVTTESLAPLSTALTPGVSPCSYGTNLSWTAIPNCMMISGHSCDLTYYTLDPALRYYARVRAVSGNHTSPWQRTNSFSPQEGRSGGGRRLRGWQRSGCQTAGGELWDRGEQGCLFVPAWRAAGLRDGTGQT